MLLNCKSRLIYVIYRFYLKNDKVIKSDVNEIILSFFFTPILKLCIICDERNERSKHRANLWF